MKKLSPLLLCDFYKIGHVWQYPKGTTKILASWTPRGSRIEGITSAVLFDLQGFMKTYLIDYFEDNFFNRNLEEILVEYRETLKECLFIEDPECSHVIALWNLGYLPLEIKAVEEGTSVPMRVPMFTIENTVDEFYWLPNALETLISTEMWPSITVATLARKFRIILDKYAIETTGSTAGVEFQLHDFSMRGLCGVEHASKVGGAHLLVSNGTDNIPAIHYMKNMYGGDIKGGNIGCSIPATEHSVMSAWMPDDEDETEMINELISVTYPAGLVSIVSDTNDFWRNVNVVYPSLKDIIMKREGKVVIRPDSGDPVHIICGNPNAITEHERKGLIEVLYEKFGGTVTDQGYKLLDEHIGAIYGDSITIERAEEMCSKLKDKGYASLNIVLGVGSYSYNYVTRDTFGQAFKSIYAIINGEEKFLSKNPKTDDGLKKSQKGMVAVLDGVDGVFYIDKLNKIKKDSLADKDLLKTVFLDGELIKEFTLEELRVNIRK